MSANYHSYDKTELERTANRISNQIACFKFGYAIDISPDFVVGLN